MDWITKAKADIAERERLISEQAKIIFVDRKLVTQVRKIIGAHTQHGYEAVVWRIHECGHIDIQQQKDIKIDTTSARMKDPTSPKWYEQPKGCHGWFMCDPRLDLEQLLKSA